MGGHDEFQVLVDAVGILGVADSDVGCDREDGHYTHPVNSIFLTLQSLTFNGLVPMDLT